MRRLVTAKPNQPSLLEIQIGNTNGLQPAAIISLLLHRFIIMASYYAELICLILIRKV